MMIVEPSDRERAEWPDATETYVEALEENNRGLRRQLCEAKTLNNIKDCPWCDTPPVMPDLPVSEKFMVSCANPKCEVQPYTTQETKLKAVRAWNRRNRSLERAADHCDYYEQKLIPKLKAEVTKHLRLAEHCESLHDELSSLETLRELVKTYFEVNEIGCECCTVRDCGECMVCLILKSIREEKDVTRQD